MSPRPHRLAVLFPAALTLFGCEASVAAPASAASTAAATPGKRFAAGSGAPVAGKDYVVLERRRFLDQAGFDRPVEAFSLLFPQGWQTEGGVKWRGVQECRGDIVSNQLKATSPDGQIVLEVRPSRTFNFAEDPMLMQAMQQGAQQGGCEVNQPFDALRYIDGFARKDLGAQASNIRLDQSRMPMMQKLDAQANAISRQYGNGMEQTSTIAFGDLKWPDGTEGILHVGVTNIITRKPNLLTGVVTMFSSTSVMHNVSLRFPAARRDEATKLLTMIQASFRANPAWQQAKDAFLTNLGNIEHKGRMDRIRLMGEQSRAYAAARSEASDRQMRDWESRQASQDKQHKAFVQTIREVETFQDTSGTVELSSGYDQAWSRGDGTYILSNAPGFDPSSVFQDQSWHEMKRADP